MKAKTRKILIISGAVVLALIAIRLMFTRNTLPFGAFLLAGIALAYLIWRAFVKNSKEELRQSARRESMLSEQISSLKQTIDLLNRELEEKNNSKINVVGLNPILHLAVLNIDSSFTRPYIRQKDNISFFGALRAEISAEYGIKMEDVLFKYDRDSNSLFLKNFHPGLISYSRKQLNWDFANAYKNVNILGKQVYLPADAYAKTTSDELRRDLEIEIDERKIEEFDWLSPMISSQVCDVLKLMIGKPGVNVILLPDDAEVPSLEEGQNSDFVKFAQIKEILSIPEPEPEESAPQEAAL
ncbi:MAG: hypothetical protein II599_05515 [Bacteroidales bacterium]|jgi:hypothetical protein|nr:hypothetical protein [Bacteroidales bacterium]MBQ2103972.1 hypothetical protein [Bacteroidales bacterium]MBQ2502450.1 hypothetical protein [Bacteroidales bacterium]MBQ4169271.1 hypothetical protein [Bacteroidales bacterium]